MSVRLPGRTPDVQLLDLLAGQPFAAVGADEQPVLPRRGSRAAGVVLQGVDLLDAGVEEEHQADEQRDDEHQHEQGAAQPPSATPATEAVAAHPAYVDSAVQEGDRRGPGELCLVAPSMLRSPPRGGTGRVAGGPAWARSSGLWFRGRSGGRSRRRAVAVPALGPVGHVCITGSDRTLAGHAPLSDAAARQRIARTACDRRHSGPGDERRAQPAQPHHDRARHEPARHRARRRGHEARRRRRRRRCLSAIRAVPR